MMKHFQTIAKVIAVLGVIGIAFAFYFQASNSADRGKNLRTKATQFEQLLPYFNLDWAKDTLWNHVIEKADYKATDSVDGKLQNFELTVYTKKDLFNDQYHVKTSDTTRNDLYEVMDVRELKTLPTKPFVSSYMSNCIIIRMNPFMLHKYISTAQEPDGITFKEIDLNNGVLQMTYHSYHDGEGTGNQSFGRNLILEDQLMYSLRSLKFADGLTFEGNVLESQANGKIGQLHAYRSVFTVNTAKTSGTVLGKKATFDCWQVDVKLGTTGKMNSYFFQKEYPNLCLKRITWDNRNLELIDVPLLLPNY